ncbi:PatB family C-S lyase [Anaerolineales bacterium]
MRFDFDTPIDRRSLYSEKWGRYAQDVLPLWVADMDFRSHPHIEERLIERVKAGQFGYNMAPPYLAELIVKRMKDRYDWDIHVDDIDYGIGMGFTLNSLVKTFVKPGHRVLIQPPVYGPFHKAAKNQNIEALKVPMVYKDSGDGIFTYEMDFDAFEAAASQEDVSLFILCNPHNPLGTMYTEEELLRFGEICLKHNVLLVSDEIHSDLILSRDKKHIPIAKLSKEIAQNTITLIAASKTFNLPGLYCSAFITENHDLKERLSATIQGQGVHTNILGYEGMIAAYELDDEDWLNPLVDYLRGNRDYARDFIKKELPQIKVTNPDATYLMWIDGTALPVDNVYEYMLEKAKIAFLNGDYFQDGATKFVRLNLGTQRVILKEALGRFKMAVDKLGS